jgi:18S rRNA (guanine1575-N7)-methyltransferase
LLLDIGCGTGLSGEVLEEEGHWWVGTDISRDMLTIAQEREVEGGLVHDDMGNGLHFRDGLFDGAISISAIQWLCHAETSEQNPRKRLKLFFESLYKTLRRGARAVLQFYPQNPEQLQLITASAMRAGFGGGVVVDFPHSTRAKKYFLCLLAGQPDPNFSLPTAMGTEGMEQDEEAGGRGHVQNEGRSREHAKRASKGIKKKRGRTEPKSREWVLHKKEGQRKQGKFAVRDDTKYTARNRRPKF